MSSCCQFAPQQCFIKFINTIVSRYIATLLPVVRPSPSTPPPPVGRNRSRCSMVRKHDQARTSVSPGPNDTGCHPGVTQLQAMLAVQICSSPVAGRSLSKSPCLACSLTLTLTFIRPRSSFPQRLFRLGSSCPPPLLVTELLLRWSSGRPCPLREMYRNPAKA